MADIRALRMTPGLGDECRLGWRLREAKRQGQLSEAQLAELAEIARSTIDPLPELDAPTGSIR